MPTVKTNRNMGTHADGRPVRTASELVGNAAFRQAVMDKTRELLELILPETGVQSRACLHWSMALGLVFHQFGVQSCMNAGTAGWICNRNQCAMNTYAYHWSCKSEDDIARYAQRGLMPEYHCWIAIPGLHMLVDPISQFLPELAQEMGLEWSEPTPPKWLWITAMPPGAYYRPNELACEMVYSYAESYLYQNRMMTLVQPFVIDLRNARNGIIENCFAEN